MQIKISTKIIYIKSKKTIKKINAESMDVWKGNPSLNKKFRDRLQLVVNQKKRAINSWPEPRNVRNQC